ncbi:MAG: ABC-F family ATP-binding cassette domain-containing protein [Trueperaceae bacterium]|nr:ABC-F family ATP-binding cassette domain-containing protein [Trueperaceae bacterium]
MELLRAEGLELSYSSLPLFAGLSLNVRQNDKIGLVGPNGSGKSTLLRLLAGRQKPDSGRVARTPGVRVGYLPASLESLGRGTVWQSAQAALAPLRDVEQALRAEEKRLSEGEARLKSYGDLVELFEQMGGYTAETALERTLNGLGFGPETFDTPVDALSGGQQRRLALARVLATTPDLLLLDEPTLHLDLPTRHGLGETLRRYPGAVLVAAHDRAFLDGATQQTLFLQDGQLDTYRGSYTRARQTQQQQWRHRAKQAKETDKEATRLAQSAATLQSFGSPTTQRRRKAVETRRARLSSVATTVSSESRPTLSLNTPALKKELLLRTEHLRVSLSDRKVIDDISFRIETGDKIALVGPNGSGKSTLLKLLAGDLESDHPQTAFYWGERARLAVFDQQTRGLEPTLSLLDQLSRCVSTPRAYQLLALVDLADRAEQTPDTLSEGQRAKAGVALVIAQEATLLLLDEPSEALDLATTERLEDALQDGDAAVVFASHDAALVDRVATRLWTIEDGTLYEIYGGLAGYRRGDYRERAAVLSAAFLEEEVEYGDGVEDKAEDIETTLAALEREATQIEEALQDPFGRSYHDLERLTQRARQLVHERSELYDRRLEPPLPRYRQREGSVIVEGNETDDPQPGLSTYQLTSNTGLGLTLLRHDADRLGHLLLREPNDRCLLPWARHAALRAVTRLAFERLDVAALQLQSDDDLSPLETSGWQQQGDWWLCLRSDFEVAEGYRRPEATKVRRRTLYFHPAWRHWVAYRRNRLERVRRSASSEAIPSEPTDT